MEPARARLYAAHISNRAAHPMNPLRAAHQARGDPAIPSQGVLPDSVSNCFVGIPLPVVRGYVEELRRADVPRRAITSIARHTGIHRSLIAEKSVSTVAPPASHFSTRCIAPGGTPLIRRGAQRRLRRSIRRAAQID